MRPLENKFQAKLDIARQIGLARHLAKIRIAWIEIGVIEDRRIERIQELAPQLEFDGFGDGEILAHRQIPEVQALPTKARPTGGQYAHVARQLDARIIALLARIHYTIGLDSRVIEVKPLMSNTVPSTLLLLTLVFSLVMSPL